MAYENDDYKEESFFQSLFLFLNPILTNPLFLVALYAVTLIGVALTPTIELFFVIVAVHIASVVAVVLGVIPKVFSAWFSDSEIIVKPTEKKEA